MNIQTIFVGTSLTSVRMHLYHANLHFWIVHLAQFMIHPIVLWCQKSLYWCQIISGCWKHREYLDCSLVLYSEVIGIFIKTSLLGDDMEIDYCDEQSRKYMKQINIEWRSKSVDYNPYFRLKVITLDGFSSFSVIFKK